VNEYARVRGRSPSPPSPLPAGEGRKARALTAEERERVEANRAEVHRHLPELVPFVRELHQGGVVDGWRCVRRVKVFDGDEHEHSAKDV